MDVITVPDRRFKGLLCLIYTYLFTLSLSMLAVKGKCHIFQKRSCFDKEPIYMKLALGQCRC